MRNEPAHPDPKKPLNQTSAKNGSNEPWEERSDEDLERVSREVMLGILRSLDASTFRVEKSRTGTFHCTFFEGRLADELELTTSSIYGKRVEEVFPEEVYNELQRHLDKALAGEVQEWRVEYGGHHYEFKLPASGLFSEGTVVGSIADVTDRVRSGESKNQLVARVERAQREAERLNYTLSHDLRNPLTVILSMCEVAQRELEKGKGDPLKRVHMIRRSANRMNEMLTDILKLSRSQRVRPDCHVVDVSSVVKDVLRQLAASNPDRDVDVHVEPGLKTFADPNLLRDLVENLLSNAWKYTLHEENPKIWVESELNDGGKWICVRDNGIGFAKEEEGDLFMPFKRLDSAAGFHGSGVGLATAKRIVEKHGGRVKATGQLGKGATFCFHLPDEGASEGEGDHGDEELEEPSLH